MFKNRLLILLFFLIAIPFSSLAQSNSLYLSAYAFYPMSSDTEWFANLGEISIVVSSPEGKLRAPVFLPEGAIVKKIILRYRQDDDTTFTMTLYRRNMYTDAEQVMASMVAPQMPVNFGNLATYGIAHRTINNTGYCYYVVIDIQPGSTSARIAGVKILYE